MTCDGCKLDCTVTVVWRDAFGRVTRRCVRCGGATEVDRPDQPHPKRSKR